MNTNGLPPDVARSLVRIEQIVQGLSTNMAGSGHWVLRGSPEAALAERQGAQLVDVAGRIRDHFGSVKQGLSYLSRTSTQMTKGIGTLEAELARLRTIDRTGSARELLRAFQPLIDQAKSHRDILQRTVALGEQLRASEHASRLSNVVIEVGQGRSWGTLVRTRLGQMTELARSGLRLVPEAVTRTSTWARELVASIRRLPIDETAAKARVLAALQAGKVYVDSVMASRRYTQFGRFLVPAAQQGPRLLAAAIQSILTLPIRVMVPCVIVDENGNPIGLPNSGPHSGGA
jgi:hypothetical protein